VRYLDMPQALAMAASQSQIRVYHPIPKEKRAKSVGNIRPAWPRTGWDAKQLQFRAAAEQSNFLNPIQRKARSIPSALWPGLVVFELGTD